MARNTSIYWSKEIAEQARQIAKAKGLSVSQLVSELIAQVYEDEFEPPIYGTCPTCHQETTFTFLALWDGLPGREAFKLYRCESCRTTLGEGSLTNVNAVPVTF